MSKWAKFIPKAVDIINKKRKIKNSLSFIQMYTNNNPIKYQYLGLPELPYIYEIGDLVALKALATPEGVEAKGHPGFKRSLGKHFWGNVGCILEYFVWVLQIHHCQLSSIEGILAFHVTSANAFQMISRLKVKLKIFHTSYYR